MSDVIDQANERAEQFLQYALNSRAKMPTLPAVGRCYNCEANLPEGHTFCDCDCRDDWQRRNPQR